MFVAMPASRARIEKNLRRIREEIAAACERSRRPPEEVCLVAVTKAVDLPTIKNLLDAGVTELGENRVQQLVARAADIDAYLQRRRNALPAPVRWHMVGHLQRNKVRNVLDCVEVIHSVDSLRLAEEINVRAERAGRVVDVLLQVNCSQEEQKFGVAVGAALHLGELIGTLKSLRLLGLMTMAPLVSDPAKARPTFTRLREVFEEMRNEKIGGQAFRHLSMGMSQDYAVAVEEGATILRIGTALFE
jgi:pyridoxal phosphate enzyme (YggS family)